MSNDRTQGTTHANAYAADGIVGTVIEVGSVLTGSQFSGSQADFKNLNGSTITGSIATVKSIVGSVQTGSIATIKDIVGSQMSGSILTVADLVGSQISGSIITVADMVGSQISGSSLALPEDGALGGMAETLTGTTAAASANFSKVHSLGVSPTFVGLTAHGTNGSNTLNLVTKDSAAIVVESALGTVAFEALVIK